MGAMFNEIVAFVARPALLAALRKESGHVSGPEVQEGAILSTTAVIGALAEWVTQPSAQEWITTELPSIDSSLDHVAELSANEEYNRFGRSVVSLLFGAGRDDVTNQVASSAGLDYHGASVVLEAATWVTVGHLARRQNPGAASHGLAEVLQGEDRDLRTAGWGPWIDAALATSDVGEPAVRGPLSSRADADRSRSLQNETYEPVTASGSHAVPRRRRMALGLVLLLAVGAGVVGFLLRPSQAKDQLASEDPAPAASSADDDETLVTDQNEDGASPTTTTTPITAVESESTTTAPSEPEVPEMVEYSLALLDPQGNVDAGGTLDLTLNTVSGEVCYAFDTTGLATPYAAHIHVGPIAGSGGITVDFGLLEAVDSGCVQAHPADLTAAASRPSVRYVEAHDPSGAFTIRGQLEAPNPAEPPPATVEEVDDRAHTAVVAGAVVLRGAVADQETMDAVVESYGDLDGTSIEVVNELRIVPGAEPPTDRVIIEDSVLFGVDSTDLSDRSVQVLDGLAEVMKARPAWSVTAVGHTDSSGPVFYNFSLSLRRASEVQRALIERGAARLTVTVQGVGPLAPAASNETSAGRAENRRIDFQVDAG